MNISNYLHEKLKWSICGAIILVPTLAISEVKPISVNTAKWQPQSSERLVKLPPSYLKKSLDRDFAGSGLGQALKSTQTDIQNKGNTLSDLQKSIETAEGELKLELRHQFLAEKRAFLDLMANQIDLNKRRANTRLNLFQKMLDELRDQNAANTPTKKELIERQNLARTRMQSSLSKVDLKIFESATVPESQYAVKYGQNVQAIENEIKLLEDQIKQVHREEENWHKNREQNAKAIRLQIRDLQDNQIQPLEDERKALDTSRRPLSKKRMALEKERMLLDPLWQELDTWAQEEQRAVQIRMEDFRDEQEDILKAQRRELDDKYYALEDEIDNIEDAFEEEFEKQLKALDDSRESLMEEKMAPLEAQAQELDQQIEEKFAALDSLYQQQATLKDQLESLEKQVRDLDRQAEFGVLEVITGAIQNAEELEKGGGIGFESFIPSINVGGDDGPPSPGNAPSTPGGPGQGPGQ